MMWKFAPLMTNNETGLDLLVKGYSWVDGLEKELTIHENRWSNRSSWEIGDSQSQILGDPISIRIQVTVNVSIGLIHSKELSTALNSNCTVGWRDKVCLSEIVDSPAGWSWFFFKKIKIRLPKK